MDTKRKLASIQRIVSIEPIAGADQIETVQILGWKCVVKKADNFKVGNLVIYVEVDSIMPAKPEFAFLEPRHYRIRTIKLKGQVSQGLVLPLSCIPQGCTNIEGYDVTEAMGIKLYQTYEEGETSCSPTHKKMSAFEKQLMKFKLYRSLRGLYNRIFAPTKGWCPLVPHTDETRIQALWNSLKDVLPTKMWYATEKLDGQSATYLSLKKHWFTKRHNTMYSREIRKVSGDCSNWDKIEKKYKIFDVLNKVKRNIYVQGEIVGPRIQKNKYKLTELDFCVFTIFDLDLNRHLSLEEMKVFCTDNGLKFVPVIKPTWYENTFSSLLTIDELVKMSVGKTVFGNNLNQQREGLVWREVGVHKERISFKVINPEFLLKEE